jgi:hypothetical protein
MEDADALVEHTHLHKHQAEAFLLEQFSGDHALVDVDGLSAVVQQNLQ